MYHYAGNNPVRFVDPDGRFNWDTNTIESGDTLTKITNEFNQKYSTHYSVDEVAKSCGIKNKDYIKAGDQLNFSKIIPEWNVTGRGSGIGFFLAAMPILSNVSEIDMAWYTVTFTINETKETFSAKFISENFRGDCIKLGVGAYIICDIQAKRIFKGMKPTQKQIIQSFAGSTEVAGISFLYFGITGSESSNWIVNTGTMGWSYGLPFSFGIEESTTRVR